MRSFTRHASLIADFLMNDSDGQRPAVVSSREIYAGRIIRVGLDVVREAGREGLREVVWHNGGAGVVACFADGTVALVRQYRHPTGRYVLELPAGRLEAGEPPEACAARELEEELGVVAERMEPLSEFYTTPGFCSERLWVFLATGLRETAPRRDEDEVIEAVRLPLGRALALVASGEIDDAKTIIGLLLAARKLGGGPAEGGTA